MGKFKLAAQSAILRIIGGPYAGREFTLTGEAVVLGRSAAVEITIPDNLLSRQHARIFREQGQWFLEDCGSKNGTWLDDERIEVPAILVPGLMIRIGKTLMQIDIAGNENDNEKFDETLISYRVAPVTATSIDHLSKAEPAEVLREQQQLATIYKLQSLLTSGLSEKEIYDRILEQITLVTPADHACLLLYDKHDDSLVPVAERDENGPVISPTGAFISRSIVEFVKQRNEGILSLDAQTDERFHGESISGLKVKAVMCVPMLGHQVQLHGIIYIVSRRTRRYEADDLKLLTSIAYSAGMAIANMRLFERSLRAERMAAIGTTASSLSHYIKNILTGLEGSVSLMRMGLDIDDKSIMTEAWGIMSSNHKYLSSLVLDLLSLARDEPLEMATYNLTETIVEAVDLVLERAAADNIDLDTPQNLRETPILATFDARALHRVLLNVLSFATENVRQTHGRTGNGKVTLEVTEDVNGDLGILQITDNGATVPIDEVDTIFTDIKTDRSDRGTGLGLVVAKRLIDQHQGELVLCSPANDGNVFTIRLPLRRNQGNFPGTNHY